MGGTSKGSRVARPRVAFFDSLRGFTIISMVAFHASYDAAYIYGFDLPWFTDPVFQAVWRASISWVFLLLAGWMTSFSRNNLKRAGIYAAAALVVFAATSVAVVDTPVNFGILYCMAACTLLAVVLRPVIDRLHPLAGVALCLVLFVLTYSVPLVRYQVPGLAWLGFPSPAFASGDYYPLIPFAFMYLAGAFGARTFARYRPEGYPDWMVAARVPMLARIGTLSLPIYLVHQPLLIAAFMVVCGS